MIEPTECKGCKQATCDYCPHQEQPKIKLKKSVCEKEEPKPNQCLVDFICNSPLNCAYNTAEKGAFGCKFRDSIGFCYSTTAQVNRMVIYSKSIGLELKS